MNATTKGQAVEVARSLRDAEQWPVSSLERLATLYKERGESVLLAVVKAELRTRAAARMGQALPYEVTLWA